MAVQQVQNIPPKFVQQLGEDLATQITAQTAVPVVAPGTGGITQLAGESADQFKARQDAAQQFDIRQQSLAGLAPQVAGRDALQTQAQQLAQAGIGSFEPALQRAQAQIAGIPTGAMTTQEAQQFMSPYQSQVIDATLAEFDRNRAIQEQNIRDQQTRLGVLGAGRAGVQLAEFGTGAARERALLQAGLLQQGFGQAAAARQQDIANRGALASQLQGLGGFQAGLGQTQAGATGTDIARLGQLGALNQAQRQAEADAAREFTRMTTFQPQEQLDRFGAQVTGIMGGYPGATQTTNIPNPTPLQTALGIGTTLAGVYGGFRNPNKTDFGSIAAAGQKIFS